MEKTHNDSSAIREPTTETKRKTKTGGTGGKNRANPQKSKAKPKSLPNIAVLEDYIRKYIIGQDKQVRSIITAIYRARRLKSIKANVLVIGKTGTGKTEMLKQIAKKLNMVYSIEDATKYTEEGYHGDDVTDMIQNLFEKSGYNLEAAQNGMLIIDEINKKAKKGDAQERDVSGVNVLNSLLKLIEGTTVRVYSEYDEEKTDSNVEYFDTSNLIIFFLGTFEGLKQIRQKRLGTGTIGFNVTKQYNNQPTRYTKKDLIEYGMPDEFVGRVDTIVEMNDLIESDLVEILRKSRLSVFKAYQKALKEEGIKLVYGSGLLQLIAKESLVVDAGARELANTVNYMFEGIIYDIFANDGKFTRCRLLSDIVRDNTRYEMA